MNDHNWLVVGEDTGGIVKWCQHCGAIQDSAGNITWVGEDPE